MSLVRIEIVEGPIDPGLLGWGDSVASGGRPTGVGSRVRFEGLVRPLEQDRAIAGLQYEMYRPMTDRVLESIAREEASRPGVRWVWVGHSRGTVPVGRVSFLCEIGSEHRAEGLTALASFIDRMKRDAPIWKRPLFGDAT